ncbi:HK97 gp10 family phage protein [Companilactobacillus allii]|uniref:HK97 gp10 family phage protein n=1 Tax=Companilactobacillus allii TaxID=1847728 RepID=A0A1P8Q4B9_9LACO|nr:HK97 gp10 family phage protein [Companilactobacillus allii]APX72712.1 hypothetical protein BTM29_09185 [Companilactobacillus allii]USQ69819.1 HK97 gp10 family phage protein [Companilactobacillus allii]
MAWGTIDDAEFQKFADRVEGKLKSQQIKAAVEMSARKIGTQSLKGVKSRTPFGQYSDGRTGGTLRRGWHINGPTYNGSWFLIEVSNDVEYAQYVENGHRTRGGGGWVSGQHMLMETLFEIDGQMPTLLTPMMKRFGGLFD